MPVYLGRPTAGGRAAGEVVGGGAGADGADAVGALPFAPPPPPPPGDSSWTWRRILTTSRGPTTTRAAAPAKAPAMASRSGADGADVEGEEDDEPPMM